MTEKEYDIGYKKPPKSGQFRPGQSGNPFGRKSGTRNLVTDLQEELASKIAIKEGGKTKKISKQRAMVKALFNKAMQGNISATNTLVKLIIQVGSNDGLDNLDAEVSENDEVLMEAFLDRILKSKKVNE